MNIDPGEFDQRITFQRRGGERDPALGTIKAAGWTKHDTVWAQVRDVLPSRAERLDETINVQRRPARIRMRYRADITGEMRIIHWQGDERAALGPGDRVMQIVSGPAELGRRQYLELMAEEHSSAEEVA